MLTKSATTDIQRSRFRLYTIEQGRFPFIDYEELMGYAKRAKSALEFGPGISTFALIEAGVKRIVTCEHDPAWAMRAVEALMDYPQVAIYQYDNVAPEANVEGLDANEQFDLAFVDSPSGTEGLAKKPERTRLAGQEDCSRLNTCLAALRHSRIVYLHDWFRANERATMGRLAAMGHRITVDRLSCFARIERIA